MKRMRLTQSFTGAASREGGQARDADAIVQSFEEGRRSGRRRIATTRSHGGWRTASRKQDDTPNATTFEGPLGATQRSRARGPTPRRSRCSGARKGAAESSDGDDDDDDDDGAPERVAGGSRARAGGPRAQSGRAWRRQAWIAPREAAERAAPARAAGQHGPPAREAAVLRRPSLDRPSARPSSPKRPSARRPNAGQPTPLARAPSAQGLAPEREAGASAKQAGVAQASLRACLRKPERDAPLREAGKQRPFDAARRAAALVAGSPQRAGPERGMPEGEGRGTRTQNTRAGGARARATEREAPEREGAEREAGGRGEPGRDAAEPTRPRATRPSAHRPSGGRLSTGRPSAKQARASASGSPRGRLPTRALARGAADWGGRRGLLGPFARTEMCGQTFGGRAAGGPTRAKVHPKCGTSGHPGSEQDSLRPSWSEPKWPQAVLVRGRPVPSLRKYRVYVRFDIVCHAQDSKGCKMRGTTGVPHVCQPANVSPLKKGSNPATTATLPPLHRRGRGQ